MITGIVLYILISSLAPTSTPAPLVVHAVVATPTPQVTETVTPVPTRKAVPATSYDEYFTKYSSEYGVDESLLKHIAMCESGIHENSVNGIYGGMFQFASSTWISTRTRMGLDINPELRFNGEEAIKTAAFKISKDGTAAWAGCL